tara:strand:- start:269 stop:979 length:711 start_codon:yes stop_codon:yes gene_type:complete
MEHNLYPAARIAEACGISRQGLNKFCREKCPDARVGNKIDINHAVMRAYMESKNADVSKQLLPAAERTDPQAVTPVSQRETKLSVSRRGKGAQSAPPPKSQSNEDSDDIESMAVSEYGNLTLNEIVAAFGTDENFRGYLDAKKKQIEIVEKELKVQKAKGEVIDRDFVSNHLFGVIQEMTSRMLVDYPRKIVEMIYAHCESGDTKEDAEATVREELGKPIKAAKAQVVKRIGENNG